MAASHRDDVSVPVGALIASIVGHRGACISGDGSNLTWGAHTIHRRQCRRPSPLGAPADRLPTGHSDRAV